jgi:hypothetical protein
MGEVLIDYKNTPGRESKTPGRLVVMAVREVLTRG